LAKSKKVHYFEVSNKMKQDLNSIKGRVAAARRAEWQGFLADRLHLYTLDDCMEFEDAPISLIGCNAP
jgi:hypothetical protein